MELILNGFIHPNSTAPSFAYTGHVHSPISIDYLASCQQANKQLTFIYFYRSTSRFFLCRCWLICVVLVLLTVVVAMVMMMLLHCRSATLLAHAQNCAALHKLNQLNFHHAIHDSYPLSVLILQIILCKVYERS